MHLKWGLVGLFFGAGCDDSPDETIPDQGTEDSGGGEGDMGGAVDMAISLDVSQPDSAMPEDAGPDAAMPDTATLDAAALDTAISDGEVDMMAPCVMVPDGRCLPVCVWDESTWDNCVWAP